jgi:hypothetical protein
MKTTNQRCCENCFFFRDRMEVTGTCTAPVPASIRFAYMRKTMFDTGGTNCAAHRMRSSRKVAASHQAQVGESA